MKNIKIYNTDAAYQIALASLPEIHVAYSKDNGSLHFGGVKKAVDYITEEEYGTAVFDVFRAQGWIAEDAHVMSLAEAAKIETIGSAFAGNTGLTDATFIKYFKGLTEFPARNTGFYNCTNLKKVYVPFITENRQPFYNSKAIVDVEVAEGVTAFPYNFIPSRNFININFPNSLVAIYNNNSYILNAEVLDLRNTQLDSIGDSFINGAGKTKTIFFPETLTSIGNDCMRNLGIINIIFCSAVPPTIGTYFAYSNRTNVKIFVPEGCVSDYEAVANLSNFVGRIYEIGGTEWTNAGLDQYE